MTKLRVHKPFHFRRDVNAKARAFLPGIHAIEDEDLQHGFIQAQIKDGRAEVVTETVTTDADPENFDHLQPIVTDVAVSNANSAEGDADETTATPGADDAKPATRKSRATKTQKAD